MSKNITGQFSLKNRVEVITGAVGLLGTQHAEAIAAFGGKPVSLDLSQQKFDSIALEIKIYDK
tara:strand:+ start:300 stop:488 length:189 start_codon:yes stop_codon:yes gene_type:complete